MQSGSTYRPDRATVGVLQLDEPVFHDGERVLLTGTCDAKNKPLVGKYACVVEVGTRRWSFVGTVDAWVVNTTPGGSSVAAVSVTGPATRPTVH